MTDRERMIEVMNKALSGLHFPLGPNVDMFHTFADRLIEAGFGRVYYKKNPTIPKGNYKYEGLDKSDQPGYMP